MILPRTIPGRCPCGGASTIQLSGEVWCAGTLYQGPCGRTAASVEAWERGEGRVGTPGPGRSVQPHLVRPEGWTDAEWAEDRAERAAIMEFEGGLPRVEAERRAGQ